MTTSEMQEALNIISQWIADGLHVFVAQDRDYMVGYTHALYEHDVIGCAVKNYLEDYAKGNEHEDH